MGANPTPCPEDPPLLAVNERRRAQSLVIDRLSSGTELASTLAFQIGLSACCLVQSVVVGWGYGTSTERGNERGNRKESDPDARKRQRGGTAGDLRAAPGKAVPPPGA